MALCDTLAVKFLADVDLWLSVAFTFQIDADLRHNVHLIRRCVSDVCLWNPFEGQLIVDVWLWHSVSLMRLLFVVSLSLSDINVC